MRGINRLEADNRQKGEREREGEGEGEGEGERGRGRERERERNVNLIWPRSVFLSISFFLFFFVTCFPFVSVTNIV